MIVVVTPVAATIQAEVSSRDQLFLPLGGRPPSLPFLRDAVAFRFERIDPRHAGQKDIR